MSAPSRTVHCRLEADDSARLAELVIALHQLRVHDVPETVQARDVWRGLRDAAMPASMQYPLNSSHSIVPSPFTSTW